MAENIYRFEFVSDTVEQKEINSGIEDTLGSGIKEKPEKKNDKKKKTFTNQFEKKVGDTALQSFLISPLNTVTGGLASPVANTIKRLRTASNVGAVLGGTVASVGIMVLQTGIQHIQKRLTELETKVQDLNNADNALIRAGSVSKATYYSYNIFGIKQTTNRR